MAAALESYSVDKRSRLLIAKRSVVREVEGVPDKERAQGMSQRAGPNVQEHTPHTCELGQQDPFEDGVRELPRAKPLSELATATYDKKIKRAYNSKRAK